MSKKTGTFGAIYAEPKRGKTLALLRAFAGMKTLYIGVINSYACSMRIGFDIPDGDLIEMKPGQRLDALTSLIEKRGPKYEAIVIADLSLIADQEYNIQKQLDSTWGGNQSFNQAFFRLRDVLRTLTSRGLHVWCDMHAASPREVKRDDAGETRTTIVPGGVQLAGWQLPEKFPAMVDVCAQVVHDRKLDQTPWPYVLSVEPSPDYIRGSRNLPVPVKFPMNIREALLLAGYDVPRPAGMEWMEEEVEQTCNEMSSEFAGKRPQVKKHLEAAAKRMAGRDPRHVWWVLVDALDRAYLREKSNNMVQDFLDSFK